MKNLQFLQKLRNYLKSQGLGISILCSFFPYLTRHDSSTIVKKALHISSFCGQNQIRRSAYTAGIFFIISQKERMHLS